MKFIDTEDNCQILIVSLQKMKKGLVSEMKKERVDVLL